MKNMTAMRELSLGQSKITAEGLKQLKDMRDLKEIYLENCKQISDEALVPLARLPSLERLGLIGTAVTDDGLNHLTDKRRLKWLTLSRTNVTPGGVRKLQAALPGCQIMYR